MASCESLVKNLSGTSEKLNGKNYLLGAQSFETFIATHRKLKHLTEPPPDSKATTYDNWYADDAVIVSWLVNSMEPTVARWVMMLRSTKKIWDTLRLTYGHKKNENIWGVWATIHITPRWLFGSRALYNPSRSFRWTWCLSAFDCRHHLVETVPWGARCCSLTIQFELRPLLLDLGQILGADSVSDLQTTFARILRISTTTPAPVVDQSAMASTHGQGRGSSRGGGWGRANNGGRPRCTHCGQMGHQVDKCWDKIDRPPTTNVTTETPPITSTGDELTVSICGHWLHNHRFSCYFLIY